MQERNHATTKEVAHILLGPCPTSLTIKWTVSSTGKVGVKLGQSLIHVLRNCIKKPHSVWPTFLSKTYKNVLPKLFNWVHTTIHSADKFLKVTHNLWHTLFMTTSTWRLGDFNILWKYLYWLLCLTDFLGHMIKTSLDQTCKLCIWNQQGTINLKKKNFNPKSAFFFC